MSNVATFYKSKLMVDGIPDTLPEETAAYYRSSLLQICNKLKEEVDSDDAINIRIGHIPEKNGVIDEAKQTPEAKNNDEATVEQRALQYQATKPLWMLESLVIPQDLREELQTAIETIQLEPLVFDTWGLRSIEPFPRSALNFHGPPGTGKTLAAHGIAAKLNKNILVASYAQIESKFHGDGPKNVEAIFYAAQRDGSVLFIDEADSLLSKRLTNVTQGSEQAINSMRSQLLICLEKYKGIVLFATNLVENYDQAFETRVRHIHFPMPNHEARTVIWGNHFPELLPIADDVDTMMLAATEEDFCGRDIKNAVIDAALQVARSGRHQICQLDFVTSINKIVNSKNTLKQKNNHEPMQVTKEHSEIIKSQVDAKCDNFINIY